MRRKTIAIITVLTFLFVSLLPAVTFASEDSLQKESPATIQTNGQPGEDDEVNGSDDINDTDEADQESGDQYNEDSLSTGQIDEEVQKDEEEQKGEEVQKDEEEQKDVQEGDDPENGEDGNRNQISEEAMNNVADTLNNDGGVKSAEEIITMLQEKNISIYDLLKVFNHISEKDGVINKEISDDELEAYADILHEKIGAQEEKTQDLQNSLEELSDLYDKVGELEKAIEVQKEAIKSDYKDLEAYKKLGEDLSKKGEKETTVFVNGEQVSFDVQPIARDGRTLVPIRAIAESLGAQVSWNQADKSVTISKDGIFIKLTLGQDIAYVNDNAVKLDVPAESLNARTLVPVRFVSEAFNSTVEWEPAYHTVVIY